MPRFNVGDRVRLMRDNHWTAEDELVVGQVYTVRTVDDTNNSDDPSIRTEEGPNHFWVQAEYFELATANGGTDDPNAIRWVACSARRDSIVRMLTAEEMTARGGTPFIDTDNDFHQIQATPFRGGNMDSFIPGDWLGELLLLRDDGRCVHIGYGRQAKRISPTLYVLDHERTDGECSYCGDVLDTDDHDGMCEGCFDATHSECAECGEVVNNDDMTNGMCQDCFDNSGESCSDCREWHPADELYERAGRMVCGSCADNYHDCCICGRTQHQDNMDYNDDSDDYCCDRCERETTILSYNAKPTPVFFDSATGRTARYFGIELELDNAGESHESAATIMDGSDFLYAKHDGSLSDGFEVVSHPGSLDVHLGPDSVWPGVLKRAKKLGYKSHDAETCGLHVHISTKAFGATPGEQDLNIAKLLLVFDRQWANILKLSRRSEEQARRWASHYVLGTLPEDGTPDETNMALRDEKGRCEGNGRYQAINLENRHTVEIRIMRGTLNEQSFRATLQFCDALVDMVTTRTVYELLDMSWTTMRRTWFNRYPELKAYCTRRMGEDELIDEEDALEPFVIPEPPTPPRPDWAHAPRDDRSICETLSGYVSESAAELWGLGATSASWDARPRHSREEVSVYVRGLREARTVPEPPPRTCIEIDDFFAQFRVAIPELIPEPEITINPISFDDFMRLNERGTV